MNKKRTVTVKGVRKNMLSALVVLMFFPSMGFAADPPGIPEGWSEEYAFVNNIRLHYYRAVPAPDKPAMIMVHGITDNGLCWTTLALQLQEDYDVYMLDARGHGLSDPFTSSDDEETLMEDVVGFIKTMEIENPVLMGHSMGAATVMRLGAEYPDLAEAIVLLDPFIARGPSNSPAHGTAPDKKDEVEKADVMTSQKISVSMHGSPEALVKQNNYDYEDLVKLGRSQFPKWDIIDVQYWALSKKQYHGAYSDAAWGVMSGNMRTGNALERISVPTLILKADGSSEDRKANQEAVKDLNKIKLLHLKDTGHNLHHDDLEQTLSEINTFLAEM